MKLRKVLSLLVAFAMILTASTAFAYTDVAADSDAYEAVTGLSALNILNGYEDGTFAPEGKVKRSEMAAIIMRALGVNTSVQTNTIFADVPATHWASGAIAEAFGAGVINGRSLQYAADGVTVVGGTFDPDAEVSYDEAVKMIVAAMGYGLKAEAMVKPGVNPFPTAYNLIADQKGITDDVEKTVGGASRATIAKLVWNALPVNLMEQTAYGSQEEFKEVEDKSLLLTKQRAVLVEAKLAALSLDPADTEISFTGVELDDVAEYKFDESVFATVDKGACDFNGLQGLKVKVLVDVKDKNDPVVIAAFPSSANKTLTVNAKLFAGIEDDVIKYYKSTDSTTLNKSSKVNDTVAIYENLEVYADTLADVVNDADADVLRFVDTDNDGYYDTLFIDDYASFVVAGVDAEAYTITADSDTYNTGDETEIVLDPEDEEVTWKMADEAGKELTVADVAVGDVITYAKSEIDGFQYWDITVCKSSAVTGTVDQVKVVKNRAKNTTVYAYTIDGKDYMLNWTESTEDESTIKVGEAGTFQITADGKIIAVKLDETVRNFAAVVAVAKDEGSFSKDVQMMVMKADGSVETLSFADEVTFGLANKEDPAAADTAYDITAKYDESAVFAATATTNYSYATDVDPVVLSTPSVAQIEEAVESDGKVVMYELNSKGEIKALYSGAGIATKTSGDYKVKTLNGAYTQSSERLAGEYLVEESALLAVDGALADADEKKEFSAITKASFLDGDTYTGTVVVDENREVAFALIANFKVYPAYDSKPMYVTGKSTVSVDGAERTKLFGMVGNDAVEYVLAEEWEVVEMGRSANVSWTSNATLKTLSEKALDEGDVIQFTVNGAGEIDAYRPLVKVDGDYVKFLATNKKATMENSTKENNAKDTTVGVALYALKTTTEVEIGGVAQEVFLTPMVIQQTSALSDDSYTMYDGFGVVGYVNRISGNNVGLFTYAGTEYTGSSDADLKDWLSNNYVDIAGNANVHTFVKSDSEKYPEGYDVKTLSSIRTYKSTGALNRTDDVLYIFKYDGEVVLQYVFDVKADNK